MRTIEAVEILRHERKVLITACKVLRPASRASRRHRSVHYGFTRSLEQQGFSRGEFIESAIRVRGALTQAIGALTGVKECPRRRSEARELKMYVRDLPRDAPNRDLRRKALNAGISALVRRTA